MAHFQPQRSLCKPVEPVTLKKKKKANSLPEVDVELADVFRASLRFLRL